MKPLEISVIPLQDEGRKITPTDVAQLIRFEQCERFLRLQLHQRNVQYDFLPDFGVWPQTIPPLLNFAGDEFEKQFENALENQSGAQRATKIKFGAKSGSGDRRREANNDQVVQIAHDLKAGQTVWLLQPRIEAPVAQWQLRGDIDILKLWRDENAHLHVLIADMKSSSKSRHEHKLQVAFYHHMMRALLGKAQIAHEEIEFGILYRGPRDGGATLDADEKARLAQHQEHARQYLGSEIGFYDPTPEREAFFIAVEELVTSDHSFAARVAQTPYHDLKFHLNYKCDGCNFNQWCMKGAAQDDDLSVLPHLDEELKWTLQKAGITTVSELAALKRLRPKNETDANDTHTWNELETVPEWATLVQKLSATRGVGARLDELIHRALAWNDARAHELNLQRVEHLNYIPSKGYGSLPFCDAAQNPNLVKIFIDTQFDYLQERLYGVSALVVAYENGVEARSQSHVHLCEAPPETVDDEKSLLERWISAILQSVMALAAPNADGEMRAPIHLIFFNKIEQKTLLDALGRHFTSVVAATPLYDFVTQIASMDGAMVTFLDDEMRELKNYPRTCTSLHEIAQITFANKQRFDWNATHDFKGIFRERIFDGWGQIEHLDDGKQWVQSRARFSSHIPLEYVYAAWGRLPPMTKGKDDFEPYRKPELTREIWLAFQARRLEAIKHIADSFNGNKQTVKSEFDLTKIHLHQGKAPNLAQALDEFLVIERHAELGGWKQARLAPPERRALAGESLVCKYLQSDQTPATLELIAQNAQNAADLAVWRAENPDKKNKPRGSFPLNYEIPLRLRLESAGSGVSEAQILALSKLAVGERVVISPRWTVDSRLSADEQKQFTPTPKQMLYSTRGDIVKIESDEKNSWIEVQMCSGYNSAADAQGWLFGGSARALQDGETYSLDTDPNDGSGHNAKCTVAGLVRGEPNSLLQRFETPETAVFDWSQTARDGQQWFLAGLNELAKSDEKFVFETSKQEFIGSHGNAPFLLVQGPPGTGKSYATSWALWARIQGALRAGRDLRVVLCCNTHSAIDVLLRNLRDSRQKLREVQESQPQLFGKYFDARLFEIPLFRYNPKRDKGWNVDGQDADLIALYDAKQQEKGVERADKTLQESSVLVFSATPGGVYRLCKDVGKDFFSNQWFDILVVDEASQMNLPEAMMAALAMKTDFALMVVGDPRQMPPIVKNDWQNEARRTFSEFKAFASLYDSVADLDKKTEDKSQRLVARIAFEESFRLHRDMAEFLRREIYAQDDVRFHSKQLQVLAATTHDDKFVLAALNPAHSLVVITHDEEGSVLENAREAELIRPLLQVLAEANGHDLDAREGLGIVVPHRAQRALLKDARWYVETVEKFQGDERKAMLFCATESDRAYLTKGGFLFDPRRLNVALSRAKRKMILVASNTVFTGFHAEEETFNNAQLWKNLLRHTCNQLLWEGERDGLNVKVWGNDLGEI